MELTDILYYEKSAQERLISGMNKLANAVKVTMGPGGRYVILNKPGVEYPQITKDGLTVSDYVKLIDPVEDMGAKIMKQASRKTVSNVGDGTTTSIVLTQALINNVGEFSNVTAMRRGMEFGKELILSYLNNNKVTNISLETLNKIALTSSNNDVDVAKKVSEVVYKTGLDGVIDLQKSELDSTKVFYEEGYKFDRGIPNSRFINDNDKGRLFLQSEGFILFVDGKLENFNSIISLVQHAKNSKKHLVIVAKEYSEGVINNCTENFKRGVLVIPILVPGFGQDSLFNIEDMALYCDGTVTTESKMNDEEFRKTTKLGVINNLNSNLQYTVFSAPNSSERVALKVKQLKNLLKETQNSSDKEKISRRISQLSTGFAVIKVGGVTHSEIDERFDRYEDSIGACRASLEEGILPGGGLALAKASYMCSKLNSTHTNEDFILGFESVLKSCTEPMKQILFNSNIEVTSLNYDKFQEGVDANSGNKVNMIDAGIIDPFKVTTSALTNAVSTAIMILSTGCAIDNTQVSVKM